MTTWQQARKPFWSSFQEPVCFFAASESDDGTSYLTASTDFFVLIDFQSGAIFFQGDVQFVERFLTPRTYKAISYDAETYESVVDDIEDDPEEETSGAVRLELQIDSPEFAELLNYLSVMPEEYVDPNTGARAAQEVVDYFSELPGSLRNIFAGIDELPRFETAFGNHVLWRLRVQLPMLQLSAQLLALPMEPEKRCQAFLHSETKMLVDKLVHTGLAVDNEQTARFLENLLRAGSGTLQTRL